MAGSVNKVILIGNLGSDPEIRKTQDGRTVASLRLATNETWNDREGQRQERVEWHRVVVFGRLAEICEKYLRKGSKIFVEGQLRTRKWSDDKGIERYTTEVVLSGIGSSMTMLDGQAGQGGQGGQGGGGGRASDGGRGSNRNDQGDRQDGGDPPADLDDDIPF